MMSLTLKLPYRQAQFLTSASKLSQCPADTGAEVAFAGRSNAGKSSAINCLTNNNKLARTSKTPGRTQLINFFHIQDDIRLVDLPGYGFAKVPLEVKNQWQKHLESYLQRRESLQGLILLMDIRHPLQDFDQMMLKWSSEANMPVHILLTKSDKLKFGAAKSELMTVSRYLEAFNGLVTAQLFSATKKQGIEQLEEVLDNWLSLQQSDEQAS